MKNAKFKIGVSYLLLLVVCLICGKFVLLINYTLTLFLHEMAHYYVAKSKGYKVNSIKLDLLGMKLNISQNIDKNDQFWIAIAGPMLNFFLCLICCAFWWIIPESYYFTSDLFSANLTLALFNILPIEPLDGGVMLNSLLSKVNSKVARLISKILNICFIALFSVLFIASFDTGINLFYAMFAIFFAINLAKTKSQNEYDLYYKLLMKKNSPITKVNLLKVEPTTNLFDCFKMIKPNVYTVFYYPYHQPKYFTELEIQTLMTKYDIKTTIKEICDKEVKYE